MAAYRIPARRPCQRALAHVGALLACTAGALALAQAVPENEMKAAYVFNFTVFTQWPQEALAAGAMIHVCANPASALLPALAALNDKVVNGHKVAIRPYATPAAARGCHVLVLEGRDRERWTLIKRELAGAAVLTVSDDSAISADGAVIGLIVDNQRIGFDVDMAAARSAQLHLSSKLLRLARSVQ